MKSLQLDRLLRHDGSRLHTLNATASEAFDLSTAIGLESTPRAVSRVIRGLKCETLESLFDEIAAALQFPPYFGRNWDALDECLADLDWIPAENYVLFVLESQRLLHDEKPESFGLLIKLFDRVAHERKSVGFHFVFQVETKFSTELDKKLQATGVKHDVL